MNADQIVHIVMGQAHAKLMLNHITLAEELEETTHVLDCAPLFCEYLQGCSKGINCYIKKPKELQVVAHMHLHRAV